MMSMQSALSRAAVALVVSVAMVSPSHGEVTRIEASTAESSTPWTSLDANDAEEDFHFVIVSDRTGGARPGVFASAIPKVNLLEPAFVVSVGDLIEGYTDDQAQLDREWDEFEGFVAGLEAPFFYAAGNHDMNNAVMARTWQARFGPSYYRFVYKDVLFLVLNSELFGMVTEPETPVPGPWTQAEQLAFIERTLRRVSGAALDHRDRPPAALGLRGRPARRLAAGGSVARPARLHRVRRPLPPLRQERPQRPQVHHLGDHRRRQQSARRHLRRVRPRGLGDDDRARARASPT